MTFNEISLDVNNSLKYLDAFLERSDIFAESSYNEYESNLAAIEARILTEGGTDDDKETLTGAASEDFVTRTKKFITKLIETIMDHINQIGVSIGKYFNQSKLKAALKKIESLPAAAKEKIANLKFKIMDTSEMQKFFEEKKAATLKHISYLKAKGANAVEAGTEAFDKLMEDYEIEKKKKAAKATIECGYNKVKSVLSDSISKVDSVTSKTASDIKQACSNIDWAKYPAAVGEALRKAISFLGRIAKDAADFMWKGIQSCFNAIKSIGGKADTASNEVEKEENKEDEQKEELKEAIEAMDDIMLDGLIAMESENMDNVIKDATESLNESRKHHSLGDKHLVNHEYDEAIDEYKKAKGCISDAIKYLKTNTSGFKGAISGSFYYALSHQIKNFAKKIRTPANKLMTNLTDMAKMISNIIKTFKEKGFDWDVFNLEKSETINLLSKLEKNYDVLIAIVEAEKENYKKEQSGSKKDAVIEYAMDDMMSYLESSSREEESCTAEEYLEALEYELFGEDEEEFEESEESEENGIDKYVDSLLYGE